jgi:hypothetical protein
MEGAQKIVSALKVNIAKEPESDHLISDHQSSVAPEIILQRKIYLPSHHDNKLSLMTRLMI